MFVRYVWSSVCVGDSTQLKRNLCTHTVFEDSVCNTQYLEIFIRHHQSDIISYVIKYSTAFRVQGAGYRGKREISILFIFKVSCNNAGSFVCHCYDSYILLSFMMLH
jgi:hypothetical protein